MGIPIEDYEVLAFKLRKNNPGSLSHEIAAWHLEKAAARIRELEVNNKDTARINWLIENQTTVYTCWNERRVPLTDGFGGHKLVMEFEGWQAGDGSLEPKKDLRDAIDKAMKGMPDGK